MRRGCTRHRARSLRQDRPARGAAGRLWRLAGRREGREHSQGGPLLRAGGERDADRGERSRREPASNDRVLELQPLPRPRGRRAARRLGQRPGAGAPPRLMGGVRPIVHRRRARVEAWARLRGGRDAAAARTGARLAPLPRLTGCAACTLCRRRPRARDTGANRAGVSEDLRRPRTRPGRPHSRHPARSRARRGRSGSGGTHLAPAGDPDPPVDEALALDVDALRAAHAAPAGRFLLPALRRPPRRARRAERPGRQPAVEPARDNDPQPRLGNGLRRRDAPDRPRSWGLWRSRSGPPTWSRCGPSRGVAATSMSSSSRNRGS